MPAATTAPHQVCNLALSYVGNSRRLNSLAEATTEAQQCSLHYEATRDELLETFPWRFATRRAELAVLAEERTGWDFVYQLPSDCLQPQRIWDGFRVARPENRIPFDVEATLNGAGTGVAGRCLLTDQEDAELIYTAECPSVALWSPTFVQAVAWALAVKLALVVPVKPQLAAQIAVAAARALERAKAAQLNARQEDVEPLSSITTARR